MRRHTGLLGLTGLVVGTLLLGACRSVEAPTPAGPSDATEAEADAEGGAVRTISLAFVGDVHVEGGLAPLATEPGATLGPLSETIAGADVAVANLESALTTGGRPAAKELESPEARYWFRSPPSVLGLLGRSGVDVASVANNHGADYGVAGLRETLRLRDDERRQGVGVVGVGRNPRDAFRPWRTSVDGVDVAVLAADDSPLESADPVWDVAPGRGPGLAAARDPRALLAAVRRADRTDDVVVVYLHWGEEYDRCPTSGQRTLARRLAGAGADVVVGSHAHVQQGAGLLDGTYVAYGLGNFLWYHGNRSETGVLRLRVEVGDDGARVVDDAWVPGTIPPEGGPPSRVTGTAQDEAVRDWRGLRGCAALAPGPGARDDRAGGRDDRDALPAFASSVRPLGATVRRRMVGASHDPASCPVRLDDLRLLTVRHVGFDGRAGTGRLVVRSRYADDVVDVFRRLYRERFPIRRMRLVDAYGGDDDRSMAADNSSAYNCRRVAGQTILSRHAFGAAIDLNPLENPYVTADGVLPPAGRRFAGVDRSAGADAPTGVIVEGDVVVQAFERIGWEWGGRWSEPDYQHFVAP